MNTPATIVRTSPKESGSHYLLLNTLTSLVVMIMFMVGGLIPQTAQAATQASIDDAISDGMAWLKSVQKADGSFNINATGTAGDHPLPSAGFIVTAFEHHAEKLNQKPLDAAYANNLNVKNGLKYIIDNATYDATNGWVWWGGTTFHNAYESGPPLMAIARSGEPDVYARDLGCTGQLKDFTLKQIAQKSVDWLLSAQITSGNGKGSYYYNKNVSNTTGDQSAAGWVTMGMAYAKHSMDCVVPQTWFDNLKLWNTYIQSTNTTNGHFGGAGYMGPNSWTNVYKTGHLLFNQALVGGAASDQNVKNALTFMDNHWDDTTDPASYFGWKGNPPSYLPSYSGAFAASKGFSEFKIETFGGADGKKRNWYNDFADIIVANKIVDSTDVGHWLGGGYGEKNHNAPHRSTAFAMLVLLRAQSSIPPVVISSAATGVTTQTATINGSLTSMGTSDSVDVIFQYGTAPGVYTQSTDPITKTAIGDFSVNLTGLNINTTFYYRSKAVGSAGGVSTGTGLSDEFSFKTPNTLTYTPAIVNGTSDIPAVTGIEPGSSPATSFTFTATPGYYLTGVSSPCAGTANPSVFSAAVTSSTFTINDPATTSCVVTATTAAIPLSVTASAGTGGTLSGATPSPQNKTVDQTAAFTFTADTGYHIASISTNGCGAAYTAPDYNGANAVTSYTYTTAPLSAPCQVSASFAGNTFPITTSVVGNVGGTICQSSSALYGTTPSCAITPDTGYHVYEVREDGVSKFLNNSITGDNSSVVSPITLGAVNAAKTVTVKFRKNTYLVSATVAAGSGQFAVADTANAADYADYGTGAVFYAKENDGSQLNSISPAEACGAYTPFVSSSENIYSFSSITGSCTVSASFGPDTTPPVITLFSIPATTQTLVIPVNLTATDNVAVKEYCITHTTSTCNTGSDSAANCAWSPDNAAPFVFPVNTLEGVHNLCARARDYAGNISDVNSQAVTIDMYNRVNIPRSGQTLCYSATGGIVACGTTGSGQDGNTLAGLVWPSPQRFAAIAENGVDLIKDTLTGLTFPKDFNMMVLRDAIFDFQGVVNDGKVDWQRALEYVAKLNTENFAGHNDWRLPNRNELATFINRSQSSTAGWLSNQGFSNTKPDHYWSSTNDMITPAKAWTVNFLEGSINTVAKSEYHYLVPVRAWAGLGTSQPVQTGQTACFDAVGDSVPCEVCYNAVSVEVDCSDPSVASVVKTGQDGQVTAGVPWPPTNRFGNADNTPAPFSG
ncbi:MAG: DUF1566 domain-containing protein, partial [Desulfuromonadaceae bacterium]|nr:DUF1566 domain-containing protein [Desulfuromonadaceae bacterium]